MFRRKTIAPSSKFPKSSRSFLAKATELASLLFPFERLAPCNSGGSQKTAESYDRETGMGKTRNREIGIEKLEPTLIPTPRTDNCILKLGALRPPGMWESRSGVRVVPRRAHVRLRATLGPPARRIFLGFAHLYATALELRFRTLAVAASRRGTAQQCWGVGKQVWREGKQANSRADKA